MRQNGHHIDNNLLVRPGWAISFLEFLDRDKREAARRRCDEQGECFKQYTMHDYVSGFGLTALFFLAPLDSGSEKPNVVEIENALKKIMCSNLKNGEQIAKTDLKKYLEVPLEGADIRAIDYLIDVNAFQRDAYVYVEHMLTEVSMDTVDPLHPPQGTAKIPPGGVDI